jgi:GGDEF domain-containing protein
MIKPRVLQIHFKEEKTSFIQSVLQENDLQVIPLLPQKSIFPFEAEQNFAQYILDQKIHLILIDPGEDHLLESLTMIEYIKESPLLAPIPILVFGGKDSTFRCEAYKKGAIGVVTDSFGSEELINLIKAVLYQMEVLKPKDAVSGLPTGILIDQEINRRLEKLETFSVACIMVNQMDYFREKYGLDVMEEVIRELTLIIKVTVHDFGFKDDYIGQMDYNQFVVVTRPERVDTLCREIIRVFETEFKTLHYNEEDRQNGCMFFTGRRGDIRKIPFISLAMGISSNEKRPIFSSTQTLFLAQEVQKKAINSNRSEYYKDQRVLLISDWNPGNLNHS